MDFTPWRPGEQGPSLRSLPGGPLHRHDLQRGCSRTAGLRLLGTYFYFGCLQNHLGPFRFDSSEIPIITLYAMYLPIFLGFMREAREEPPFRRFVLPALALCSGLFMVIAGILSYQWDCLYYLLFFAVFMAAGALFYKRKSL